MAQKIKIIEKRLDELTPYANNPRNNAGAIDAVAASLQEFGWKQPVVIDKAGVIIAGHTRIKAAEKLGLETAPCIIADDLTEEQVRAYRLADNKTAELAEWKFELLGEELEGIYEINMSAFGFDDGSEEELKYKDQETELEQADENTPESRVIVASVSLFGEDSEAFVVSPLPPQISEKLLKEIEDKNAEQIAAKIEKAITEVIA